MTQTVVLVPGFLGFDHIGSFTYFADRFVAGLSMALKLLGGGEPYRVLAVPSIPIGSLAMRQEKLIESLNIIARRLNDEGVTVSRWHLVGHSTGGLDAAFLTRTDALRSTGRRKPSEFGSDALPPFPQPIASVTTIGAPFYGSTLALCDIARMTEGGPVTANALDQAASGLVNALSGSCASRLPFALGVLSGRNQTLFVYHLLFADGLALDLRPHVVSKLTETDNRRKPEVPHFSIATFAPDPEAKRVSPSTTEAARDPGIRSSEMVSDASVEAFAPGPVSKPEPVKNREVDSLFRQLYTLTADAARRDGIVRPPPFPARGTYGIIHSKGHGEVYVTPESNDGVVNTERQVFGHFAGLVVGDHADVIGRYRRADLTTKDQNLDDGLLTSGAHFRDPQFFDLIHLVARGILAV
jgi:hypothetical protein